MRIVSISPFMPYSGIPHAGGELFRRHAEIVSQAHDLVVVSPARPSNEVALTKEPAAAYGRILVTPRTRAGTARPRVRRSLVSRAVSFLTMGPFWRGIRTDEATLAELRRADRIELQWFDAVVLAPRLRRLVPGTPLVGVFHDVVSQGHRRRVFGRRVALRHRLLSLLRLLFAVPLERRALRALDTAVVLSEKDRALLARRGGGARIVVVPIPLDDADMPPDPRQQPPAGAEVLFVGALWRAENEDAARWLLADIWPTVRSAVPDARLVLAGAEPTAGLLAEAGRRGSVEVTGYVESLSPYYRRAAVVVVPVRLGAGVKVKAVVALLWGLPVVTTTTGAEGVTGPDVFFAVEDDAARFADAVVRALTDPAAAAEAGARAHHWSHGIYSASSYAGALDRIYG
jgi:glycosyltransferase involved in cell wall biosynthesis